MKRLCHVFRLNRFLGWFFYKTDLLCRRMSAHALLYTSFSSLRLYNKHSCWGMMPEALDNCFMDPDNWFTKSEQSGSNSRYWSVKNNAKHKCILKTSVPQQSPQSISILRKITWTLCLFKQKKIKIPTVVCRIPVF